MKSFAVIRVHKSEFGQSCKVLDTFNNYSTAYIFMLSNVKLFKDSLVEIIDDVFDCYDLIINLFGGQCQII